MDFLIDYILVHLSAAYLNDIVVGAICWREEASSQKLAGSSGGQQLYIMTLGVLPAYQRLGVGKRLVNHVLEEAQMKAGTESVYLHVWVLLALTYVPQHLFDIISLERNR